MRMCRSVAVLLLATLTAACGDDGEGAGSGARPDGGDAARTPDGGAGERPLDGGPDAEPEVVVPKTTKVADADTRAALTAFEKDGTLRFSRSTAVLDALLPGDVVVSEPSAAAPHGYLRRVMAVDRSGGRVVIATTQATLSEAIDQGRLNAVRTLSPDMLSKSEQVTWPMVPGVRVLRKGQGPLAVGPGAQLIAADGDYPFFVKLDASLGSNLKAEGFMGFGMSLDFQIGIGGKWTPPFVKINHVRAGLGIRQKGSISLVAGGGVKVKTQVTIAIFPFTPIVFAIGPVPVVITPILKIHVGAEGELMASLTYSVSEEVPFAAGLEYTADDGFRPYSSGTPTYESGSVMARVSASVKAYAGARGDLLLYGVAGGFIDINGVVKLDAVVPRYPIWKLTGAVEALAGVHMDLIVTTFEEKASIGTALFPIADAPNFAPSLRIVMPASGTSVDASALGGTRLVAEVSDIEDGPACCPVVWTDDKGDKIPPGKDVMASFSTPGMHTVRATATDLQGSTSSAMVVINVTKRPPTVEILKPVPMQGGIALGVPTAVEGRGMDGAGMISCDRLTWTSSVSGDVFSSSGKGCVLTATFATEGARRLTLTATDEFGMTGTATVDVTVGPKPTMPVVSAFIDAPGNGVELRTDAEHTLRGRASDTDNRVFKDFVWRATGCGIDQVIGTTAGGTTGTFPFLITVKTSTLMWRPATTGFSNCDRVELRLKVTTADEAGVGESAPTAVKTYKLQ